MAYTNPYNGQRYGGGNNANFTDKQNTNLAGGSSINGGTPTDSDSWKSNQFKEFYYYRHALTEAAKEQYFQQFATVRNLEQNTGKVIKQYVYYPLLDDRNINDQGIDATGAYYEGGNLYGSSKDISTIMGKLPVLGESGGRYNRVGTTRSEIQGTIAHLGFFMEFTEDEFIFDSDTELKTHIFDEAMKAANEIVEDVLQIDLINACQCNVFHGATTDVSGMKGADSEITYDDLVKWAKRLSEDRVPTKTRIFTGSRNIDTKTIDGGWVLAVGRDMLPTFMHMLDYHGNPAFTPAHQYAAGVQLMKGEVGSIYKFRIVEVPEMLFHAGKGADASSDVKYQSTNGKYNAYPIMLIGDESFTTIGFRSDGKQHKFKIITKMPSAENATRDEPYGKTGFWSIQWYYGTMLLRPERLQIFWSTALA